MEGRCAWNQKMVDSFLACTTCELCVIRCCAGLPIERSWMNLRGKLIHEKKKMTFPPFEMMAAALAGQGNIWAGYRKDRFAWFPEDLREKHGTQIKAKNVYFAGCTASFVECDISIATVRLLDTAGIEFTCLGEKENCCATPMLMAGKWDLFADTMRKNIAAVREAGADTVICSCPACDMMWRSVYPKWAKKLGIDYTITARHYTEAVAEKIRDGSFTFPNSGRAAEKVTWHDSCHAGRVSGLYDEPRELIRAVPNTTLVEMEHTREKSPCCGSVLTLIKDPPVAAKLGKDRLDEAVDAGVSKVLALCPCCEFQFRVTVDKKNLPLEIVDLAHYVASALNVKLPDPAAEVKAQWAVFEAMIALMTPEGFAALMGTMWRELIDAMPLGMGKLMRICGRIPGALPAMKPLFPVLFPVLLPLMMPKVMPVMLARVKERVPMPGYMAEQMPGLMPKVMDNLMPHMIGDVAPLIAQPMIDYLRHR
jgi:Fe-S oxidoreductase